MRTVAFYLRKAAKLPSIYELLDCRQTRGLWLFYYSFPWQKLLTNTLEIIPTPLMYISMFFTFFAFILNLFLRISTVKLNVIFKR